MNQREVEKHIKFDMILTVLIYLMIAVALFVSLFFILLTPAKAMIQTYTATNSIYSPSFSPCGYTTGGKYCTYNSDNTFSIRNVNTTYNGVAKGITFTLFKGLNADRVYSFDITAMGNDFRNNNLEVLVYGSNDINTQGSLVSAGYTFVSRNKIRVSISNSGVSYHTFIIDGTPLTGDTNYGIRSIVMTFDDGQMDSSSITNNATENAEDIMNNANENTESIINNQNINNKELLSQLSDLCTNLIDMNNFTSGVLNNNDGSIVSTGGTIDTLSASTGSLSFTNSGSWTGVAYSKYIDISDSSVYLNFESNAMSNMLIKVVGYDSSFSRVSNLEYWRNGSFKLCTDANVSVCNSLGVKYIRFSIETYDTNSFNLYNLRVNTTNGSFCPYGSRYSKLDGMASTIAGSVTSTANILGSKIDDVKALEQAANQLQQQANSLQQAQNDYLMDNSDPTVNQSGINNVISGVQVQDPLNYLLTLPINLLTKLNTLISSGTCNRASFGELYGTEIYLPCVDFSQYLGSSLWTTIDTIVGIGLLVIIIKKFYDTISNILSLGKEEEIRKGMELPTPMEFLAQILGGGK